MPEDQEMQEQQTDFLTPSPDDFLKDAAFDRFRGEDGNIDTAKMGKSYRELEKKLGRGAEDLPPESPDEYEYPVDMPEGMTPESTGMKALAEKLHKAGAGKRVVNVVMQEYKDLISKGLEGKANEQQERLKRAEEVLREKWGVNFDTEMARAKRAFAATASDSEKAASSEIAGFPAVVELLAKLGRNLEEDSPAQAGSSLPSEDLSAMMKSEAYWNAKHPDHDRIKQRVNQHFMAKSRK